MKTLLLWILLPSLLLAQNRTIMVNSSGAMAAPTAAQFKEQNDLASESETQAALDTKLETVITPGGPFFEHFTVTEWQVSYRGTTGLVTTVNTTDAVLETYTVNPSVTDYQAIATYERNPDESVYSYASSDVGRATVDLTGAVQYVSDGIVDITVSLGSYSKTHSLNMSSGNTYNVTNIVAGVTTYLRYDLTEPVDAALVADAGANDDELFDTKDWGTHTYVRNVSSWAYTATGGTDAWSGLAVWATGKTGIGPSIRGTLISPDLVACAWHNRPAIGSEYKWLGTDNILYTRTVLNVVRVGTGDGCLLRLDTPLPAAVQPLKILPANYTSYFHFIPEDHWQIPLVVVNKQLQAMVADFTSISSSNNNIIAGAVKSALSNREPYYELPIGGDSGSPVMMVLGNELILILTWHTPSYGGAFIDGELFNAAVSTLGATPPTVIDLSSYPQSRPAAP